MSYKHPGITKPTVKSSALGTQVMLGLKKAVKVRKAETVRRKPYDRYEDVLRTNIIKHLRKFGLIVFRLEPSTRGKWGISDLLVFDKHNKKHLFLEIKTKDGKLSADQQDFRELCEVCGLTYKVAHSLKEACWMCNILIQ